MLLSRVRERDVVGDTIPDNMVEERLKGRSLYTGVRLLDVRLPSGLSVLISTRLVKLHCIVGLRFRHCTLSEAVG